MLSYSKSWCQISTLPTGGQTDSVLISIDYIKLANKKLIEEQSHYPEEQQSFYY